MEYKPVESLRKQEAGVDRHASHSRAYYVNYGRLSIYQTSRQPRPTATAAIVVRWRDRHDRTPYSCTSGIGSDVVATLGEGGPLKLNKPKENGECVDFQAPMESCLRPDEEATLLRRLRKSCTSAAAEMHAHGLP